MKSIIIKGLFLVAVCILIFLIIQYIFILNEGFENNGNNRNNSNNSNNSNKLKIDKRHRITFNKIGDDYVLYVNNYIPQNSNESICIKTGLKTHSNYNYSDLISKYKENIVEFSTFEMNKLKELIEDIIKDPKLNNTEYNSEYSKFVSEYASGMKWNILKTRNLELNLPCTISNYILFPESQLKTKNWELIRETLMHEQIHILQRQYQEEFNELYKQLFNNPRNNDTIGYGFNLLPIKKEYIDFKALEIKYVQIQNPDEDNTEWLIYDNYLNNYYVVPYIINRTTYQDTHKDIERSKNSQNSKLKTQFSKHNSQNLKHNSEIKNMPHVFTQTAFKVNLDKTPGPHNYVVTGQNINVEELEYYKYLMKLTNNKHVNIAHPNETFTDLFLTI